MADKLRQGETFYLTGRDIRAPSVGGAPYPHSVYVGANISRATFSEISGLWRFFVRNQEGLGGELQVVKIPYRDLRLGSEAIAKVSDPLYNFCIRAGGKVVESLKERTIHSDIGIVCWNLTPGINDKHSTEINWFLKKAFEVVAPQKNNSSYMSSLFLNLAVQGMNRESAETAA